MIKKLIALFCGKPRQLYYDPMDFSHAVSLKIIIKKDGAKEYHPFGYSSKPGTPITTIEYEE